MWKNYCILFTLNSIRTQYLESIIDGESVYKTIKLCIMFRILVKLIYFTQTLKAISAIVCFIIYIV